MAIDCVLMAFSLSAIIFSALEEKQSWIKKSLPLFFISIGMAYALTIIFL